MKTIASSRRIAVGFAILLVAGSVRAQPAPAAPPTAQQIEAGRALYRQARELRRQGRSKEALEKSLEAYRTASTPVTALETARLLVDAGRLVAARDLARGVARLPVSPRESDKGREARRDAAALAISLDARVAKIAIADRPSGLPVLVDGVPTDAAADAGWRSVDPGAHEVVVGDPVCMTTVVTLTEGETRTIDLQEASATCRAAAAPPSTASPQPAAASRAAPGTPAAPTAASSEPARSPLVHDGSPGEAWTWTGAALVAAGALLVGAGGFLALSAKRDYDAVASDCPARGCSSTAYDVRQSARTRADVATVVMGVGGLAVAGGIVLIVARPRGSAPPRTGVALALGPGGVTVRVPLR